MHFHLKNELEIHSFFFRISTPIGHYFQNFFSNSQVSLIPIFAVSWFFENHFGNSIVSSSRFFFRYSLVSYSSFCTFWAIASATSLEISLPIFLIRFQYLLEFISGFPFFGIRLSVSKTFLGTASYCFCNFFRGFLRVSIGNTFGYIFGSSNEIFFSKSFGNSCGSCFGNFLGYSFGNTPGYTTSISLVNFNRDIFSKLCMYIYDILICFFFVFLKKSFWII